VNATDAALPAPDAASETPPIHVIWNRNAGRKAGLPTNVDVAEDRLEALFTDRGMAVAVEPTGSEQEARERTLAAASAGARAIVAAGGDGTLRTVARALLGLGSVETTPPLGILPLGSVMNVARSLGIPRDLDAAAAVIAAGNVRTIDVGSATGADLFLEGAAVGLHAELFREGVAFDEGDRLAPLRAIWTALRYQPSRLTLRLDERTLTTRALVVSVSNGPFAGIGFTVAPGARLDDGLFDVRVFERFSRWELLRHFGSIAVGRRAYEPRVATHRTRTVRISSATPLHVRADGEDLGRTPVELRVIPQALRVLAPRPSLDTG
jgi:diacylglycerol kinase (ATP)